MKCQKCGVNEATTHIKTMINGQYTEYYLCPDCAEKMGYTNMFGDFSSETLFRREHRPQDVLSAEAHTTTLLKTELWDAPSVTTHSEMSLFPQSEEYMEIQHTAARNQPSGEIICRTERLQRLRKMNSPQQTASWTI